MSLPSPFPATPACLDFISPGFVRFILTIKEASAEERSMHDLYLILSTAGQMGGGSEYIRITFKTYPTKHPQLLEARENTVY